MTLQEFKALNEKIGNHWFSEDTMSFFDSKIHDFDESSGIFITSEQQRGHDRGWTIRKANFDTGRVESVSQFQAYDSYRECLKASKKLLLKA